MQPNLMYQGNAVLGIDANFNAAIPASWGWIRYKKLPKPIEPFGDQPVNVAMNLLLTLKRKTS